MTDSSERGTDGASDDDSPVNPMGGYQTRVRTIREFVIDITRGVFKTVAGIANLIHLFTGWVVVKSVGVLGWLASFCFIIFGILILPTALLPGYTAGGLGVRALAVYCIASLIAVTGLEWIEEKLVDIRE